MASVSDSAPSATFGTLHAPPGMAFELESMEDGRRRTLRLVPNDDPERHIEEQTLDAPASATTESAAESDTVEKLARLHYLESVYCDDTKGFSRQLCGFMVLGLALSKARLYHRDEKPRALLVFNIILVHLLCTNSDRLCLCSFFLPSFFLLLTPIGAAAHGGLYFHASKASVEQVCTSIIAIHHFRVQRLDAYNSRYRVHVSTFMGAPGWFYMFLRCPAERYYMVWLCQESIFMFCFLF